MEEGRVGERFEARECHFSVGSLSQKDESAHLG